MEYRKRCNVCGKIWCYTDEDLRQNSVNATSSALASLGAIVNIFGGTTYKAFEFNKMADRNSAKIVDYSKCPYCNSSDISDVGEDEWGKLEQSHQASTSNTRSVVINDNASREALLKRVKLFIDDDDWDSAKAYCEHLLDADPEDGDVYFMELLIELRVKSIDEIIKNRLDLCGSKNYAKAQKYGSAGVTDLLSYAIKEMDYNEADRLAQEGTAASLSRAAEMFALQPEHRDSAARAENCRVQIAQLQQAERERLEQEAKEREEAERRRAEAEAIAQAERERAMARGKKIAVPVLAAAGAIAAVVLVVTQIVIPQSKYNAAENLLSEGGYDEAIVAFEALGDYKDAAERVTEAENAKIDFQYNEAVSLKDSGKYERAIAAFDKISEYKDSTELKYAAASALAAEYEASGDIENAIYWYEAAMDVDKANEIRYTYVVAHKDRSDRTTYQYLTLLRTADYKDSASIYSSLYKLNFEIYFSLASYGGASTPLTALSLSSNRHDIDFHYRVTGGPLGSVKLKFVLDGELASEQKNILVMDEKTIDVWANGSSDTFQFFIPGARLDSLSKLRETIYDVETGEQLAQVELPIVD